MMKSKNKKIQKILTKGIAIALVGMFSMTPIAFATSSLDDSYLEGSFLDKVLYGTIGSTAKEIEEYLVNHTTLYIYNEIQLRALAEYVNSGNDCNGKEIKLSNDIVVDSSQEWIPIGNIDNRFKGTFDGQGHTISGINFNRNDKLYSEISYVGLFGYVQNSIIKNIRLSNSKFNIPYDVSNDILDSSDDIADFDGTNFTSRYRYLGGIVGYNNIGTIENCTIDNDVIISGMSYVGGIVGANNIGKILNCSNNGFISGFSGVGGIAGGNYGRRATNINISNTLDFSNTDVAKIINCTNRETANVYALIGTVGGIAGLSTTNAVVQKSVNYGTIKLSTEEVSLNVQGEIKSYKPHNIGGIVGYTTGGIYDSSKRYTLIDGCINFGEVIGYRDVGGIVGQLGGLGGGYAILSNCINYSLNVTSTITNSTVGEAGYLAGEVGSRGNDAEDRGDDAIAFLYNNFYVLNKEVLDKITAPAEYQLAKNETTTNSEYKNDLTDATNLEYARKVLYCDIGLHNKSGTEYNLGYGDLRSYSMNGEDYVDYEDVNDSTSAILKTDSDRYFALLNRESTNEAKFYAKRLNNSNYFFTGHKAYLVSTKTNNGIDYQLRLDSLKIKLDNSINAFKISGEIWELNNSESEYILDSNSGTTVSYTVSKKANGENTYTKVDGNAYFKEGDTIRITAKFNRYLASAYGPLTAITTAPSLKMNNLVEMAAGRPSATRNDYTTTVDYTYEVRQGDSFNVNSLTLQTTGTIYAVNASDYATNAESRKSFSSKTITSNISTITIDTIAPVVNTKVYVENALETGRYTAGKEVLIKVTTNEPIKSEYELPELQVKFSKSGVGKYNYNTTTETVGYARCKDAKINVDGTTTWSYLYQIQEGDEGDIQLEYKAGKITDLAGNVTDIRNLYTPSEVDSDYSEIKEFNDITVKSVRFYEDSNCTREINLINDSNQTRDIYIKVELSDALYSGINTKINFTTAPRLYLNSNISTTTQSVSAGKTIVYKYNRTTVNTLTSVKYVTLKNENITLYTTSDLVSNANGITTGKRYTYDTNDFILDPIGVNNNIEQDDIYADTTAPTVKITAEKLDGTTTSNIANNITNADTIKYTFIWSEEVVGFTSDDITVNTGTKGELKGPTKNEDGTYSYTMDITTNVENGNVGDIQVIVEPAACRDLVAHSNVRTESVIRVDKKAPILIGLEAYATSDITLGDSINDVKENYKTGDTVTIVATFDESIESTTTVPTLALQFSKSGNAKGSVTAGKINGNKITYTYTITNGDTGTLSVKGFTGTVVDSAGNETKVTKRALDGDTIIADSEAPKIVGITAIAPDFKYDQFVKNNEEDTEYLNGETKRYGVGEQIKFLVEFNEDLYHLDSNKKVEKIVSETAPTLKIKFGTGTIKDAVFSKIDGKVLEYTYDIQSGDNENLSLVSMTGVISDIAGNSITNHSLVTLAKYEDTITEENKVDNIMADTTSSTVKIKVTQIENDGLTGTQNHYKAGNILTITATTNEYVYSKSGNNLSKITSESAPSLGIKFGEENAKGSLKCTKVDYIYDENLKTTETIFTYEYVIATGDNGEISLSFGENKYYDIALNGNVAGTKDNTSKIVIADTIAPNTSHLQGSNDNSYIKDNGDGTYSVLFTEKLYYLNNNIVTALTSSNIKDNGPVLVLKDGEEYQQVKPSSISTVDGQTMITYNYGKAGLTRIGLDNYDKICDIAGNMYNSQVTIAPTLANIKIISPEDKTVQYRTDTKVTIIATFTKRVQGTVPTLKIKFGDEGTERNISSGTIDKDTITYQYTIQEGDNGTLRILSLEGNGLRGEDGTLYEAPETISLTGKTITADTTKPTVQIKAYTDYKTSSKKEVSGKINAEITTYEFTWIEEVRDFTIEDITVINGIKDTFTKVSNKVYTLDVINSNEGIQTVAVPSGVCTDTAKLGSYNKETGKYIVEDMGNPNESARINSVEIDRTAPTVRFITPNGGNYTTTTDSRKEESTGTATLKARIEINENVSAFKYRVVKTGGTVPDYTIVPADQINSSDIDITISNATVGEYVVEVIAIDEAGNERQAKSNKYTVIANTITLTPNTTEKTKEDITVTVNYGEALTENRKAGIQGKTQSADSAKVIIGENGTVYAEATDIAGNKVYATLKIDNIDKTAPKATISYTTNDDGSVTATISFDEEATVANNDGKPIYTFTENGEFTFEFEDSVGNKGTATAKVTNINKTEPTEPDTPPVEEDKTAPEVTFNYTTTTATIGNTIGATITTNEDAIIEYSWDNQNWTASNDYTRNVNVKRTPTNAGTYTLYAKATDKANNQSKVSKLQFIVVKSDDDIVKPEVIFEDLTTIQKDGVKYVKVSPTFTTAELTAKMDEDALCGKTPEYAKLTSDNNLRTGSEITIDGDTKYIIIVNGDVNCDGKVDFLNDIVMINNYRIGINKNLSDIQILAGDINNSGTIEFIPDIVAMNNYRLGRIKVL